MKFQECIITKHGKTCFSKSNIINSKLIKHAKTYIFIRIFEILIKNVINDIIINLNDREKINTLNELIPTIDFY